ncbi:hypothetical protein [Glycomyces buryatensis]|uniref:Uncharacterized protein n=1 Tax=Glycomyces buryatensis TaxID=2570927 RepID=A0A4S8QFN6_9ACTN|nr:hypothetical protein [Glycomyces buryatensis]THV43507.1 hypothetical protein FAB82_00120 [Glycomyces buryatensis]
MRRLITLLTVFGFAFLFQIPAQAIDSDAPRATASFNDDVMKVTYSGDTVYVGGLFTRARKTDGTFERRSHLAAVNSVSGELLSFAPQIDGPVHDVVVSGDYLYAAGSFRHVGEASTPRVARFFLSSGELDASWRPVPSATVYSIEPVGDTVYLGGTFAKVGRFEQARLAAVTASDGTPLTGFVPRVQQGAVRDLQLGHDRLYAAGAFSMMEDEKKYGKLAAVDLDSGAVDRSFESKVYVLTREVAVAGERVFAALDGRGGEIRAFERSGETAWYQAVDGGMQSVAVWGDVVIGGGHFDKACVTNHAGPNGECVDGVRAPRGKLLAVDSNGKLLPWNPNANGVIGVWDVTTHPQGANLTAGGTFTTFGGGAIEQKRLAVFD